METRRPASLLPRQPKNVWAWDGSWTKVLWFDPVSQVRFYACSLKFPVRNETRQISVDQFTFFSSFALLHIENFPCSSFLLSRCYTRFLRGTTLNLWWKIMRITGQSRKMIRIILSFSLSKWKRDLLKAYKCRTKHVSNIDVPRPHTLFYPRISIIIFTKNTLHK